MADSADIGNNDAARADKNKGLANRVPKVVAVPEVTPIIDITPKRDGGADAADASVGAGASGEVPGRVADAPLRASAANGAPLGDLGEGAPAATAVPLGESALASTRAQQGSVAHVIPLERAKDDAAQRSGRSLADVPGVGAQVSGSPTPVGAAAGVGAVASAATNADVSPASVSDSGVSAGQSTPRPSVKGQAKGKPRLRAKKQKGVEASSGAAASNADAQAADADADSGKKESPFANVDVKKALAIAGIVLAVVAVVALLVSWNRWWRYDDARDFQGQWFSQGTQGTAVVTIDDAQIRLSGEVSYAYSIDPTAKTISYDFGTMHGQGRYWFSGDRETLVIIDGSDYSASSTFFEDFGIWLQGLLAQIQGKGAVLPASDNAVYLVKTDPSASGESGASQSNAGMAAGADNDVSADSATVADASNGAAGGQDAALSAGEAGDSASSADVSANATAGAAHPVVTEGSDGASAGDNATPTDENLDEAFGVAPNGAQ